jgi:hypothetical protein
MRVVKYGRTSKETVGTVDDKINVDIDYLEKQKRGRFDVPQGVGEVLQWTIVGEKYQPFSQLGDSGSWVVNIQTGKLVALLFGEDRSGVKIRAFVTDIMDVGSLVRKSTLSVPSMLGTILFRNHRRRCILISSHIPLQPPEMANPSHHSHIFGLKQTPQIGIGKRRLKRLVEIKLPIISTLLFR